MTEPWQVPFASFLKELGRDRLVVAVSAPGSTHPRVFGTVSEAARHVRRLMRMARPEDRDARRGYYRPVSGSDADWSNMGVPSRLHPPRNHVIFE